VLVLHAIGMGLAAGVSGAMSLRLLGVPRGMPRRELERFVPFMWLGFVTNAASGVLLLVAYPTKALTNPVFYLKLGLIAVAIALFLAVKKRHDDATGGSWLGAASLVCWAGAITSGRLLAYTYSRLMADW
jgi:hypothetical protein